MRMVVANRLTDGRVVFLSDATRWVERIDDGAVARFSDQVNALLAVAERSAEAGEVVDPYAIDVSEAGGSRRPTSLRESIRAFGPSIADLGR